MTKQSLSDLLRKPVHYEPKEQAWGRLTTGNTLYQALKEAVRANRIGDALGLIESWKDYAQYASEQVRQQWEIAYKLVRCATQLASRRESEKAGFDANQILGQLDNKTARVAWERVCLNTLLDVSGRQVQLPTTGVSQSGVGFNATIVLELLPGNGQLVHHPIDAFTTRVDPLFHSSIEDAWTAAQSAAAAQGIDVLRFDGCWRVLDEDDQPIAELNGSSASGGAALGWFQSLEQENTYIDDCIVVMACSDREGRLGEVEGIAEKTQAVVKAGHIDTIIVAGENNQREAEIALRQSNTQDSVRVVLAETLLYASKVRSQLALGLIKYCQNLIGELDKTPWYGSRRENVRISDIVVPVRVFRSNEGLQNNESSTEELQNDVPISPVILPPSAHAADISGTQLMHDDANALINPELFLQQSVSEISAELPIDPGQSKLYEEGQVRAGEEIPWGPLVWPPPYQELVVVIAGPGGGKTVHSKYAAIQAAEVLCTRLQRREVSLNAVSNIPIWLPIIKLASSDLPGDTAAAILAAIENHFSLFEFTPAVREFIKERLKNHAMLFFDGLDELYQQEQRVQVSARFRAMQDWISPCCVTCRTENYEAGILGRSKIVEYSLAPFRGNWTLGPKYEIENFIAKWFASEPQLAAELLEILGLNFAIHHQCRSPLLLTLTCLAHQSRVLTEKTTCADLFNHVLVDLLRGRWRNVAVRPELGYEAFPHDKEDLQVNFARKLLPYVAYNLIQSDAPEDSLRKGPSRNRFLFDELLDAMEAAPKRWRPRGPGRAIEWLEIKGILVNAGYEGAEPCYSFVHRALLEYLVAQALMEQPDYLGIIERKITDPNKAASEAWCYILPPLVGSLDDPLPVIKTLIKVCRDDAYRDYLETFCNTLLACLLECKSALTDEAIKAQALDTVLARLDSMQKRLKEREWGILENPYELARLFAAVEKHYGSYQESSSFWKVVDQLQQQEGKVLPPERRELLRQLQSATARAHPAAPIRWASLWAHVILQKKQAYSVVAAALNDSSAVVRALAARALVAVNRDTAYETLIDMLLRDEDDYAQGGAAGALGRLGDVRALEHLKAHALMESEPSSVIRAPAMWALTRLAKPEFVELGDIFRAGLDDDLSYVRSSSINGIVTMNCRDVWPRLVDILEAGASPVERGQAAWALGRFGIPEAVTPLVKHLSDEEVVVATKCCTAIMNYALDEARPQVEAFLAQADENQKRRTAYGWREAARKNRQYNKTKPGHFKVATELCVEMTGDDSARVRETSCRTLSFLVRLPVLRQSPQTYHSVAERALKLLDDNEPKVKMAACDLLSSMTRANSPGFVRDGRFIHQVLMKALELLDKETTQQAKASACSLMIEMARAKVPVLMRDELLRQRVIKEILNLLTDISPQVKANALLAFQVLLSIPTRHQNVQVWRDVAEGTLNLLHDDAPAVRVNALVTLKIIMQMEINLQDETLNRKLVTLALQLLDDPVQEVRACSCWVISQMARAKSPALSADSHLKEVVVNSLAERLSTEANTQAEAYALRGLFLLLPDSALQNDEKFIRMMAERSLELLTGDSPHNNKANALGLLYLLVQMPLLRNNRHFQLRLVEKCLMELEGRLRIKAKPLLQNQFDYMRSNALSILGVLARMNVLKNNDEFMSWTLNSCLNLSYDPSQMIKAHALNLLVIIAREGPAALVSNKEMSQIVLTRGLELLNDPVNHVRMTSMMVLEEVVSRSFTHDHTVSRRVAERCLELLRDQEQDVRSTAIRTFETIILQTDWGNSEDLSPGVEKRYLTLLLKGLDDKSEKVRATTYGVVSVLAAKSVFASEACQRFGEPLVKKSLAALDDKAISVRTNSLLAMEELLTNTKLKNNRQLNQFVANKFLRLLEDREPEQLKGAVLRALEKVVLQTVLKDDHDIGSKIIKKSLAMVENGHSLKVRKTAYGALQTMTVAELSVLRADQLLSLMLVKKSLSALTEQEREMKGSACFILASMIKMRLQSFISDEQMMRTCAERSLVLLSDTEPGMIAASHRLILAMLEAPLAGVISDQEWLVKIARQSLKLLAARDPRIRINASDILARLMELKLQKAITLNESLVDKICEVGRALLRDGEPARVQANALTMLRLITQLPAGRKKEQLSIDVLKNVLGLLRQTNMQVKIKACDLLVGMLSSKVAALNYMITTVAQQGYDLLFDDNSPVRASGCWLLEAVFRLRSHELFENEQLVRAIAERARELRDNDVDYVTKNAKRLLEAMSKDEASELSDEPQVNSIGAGVE
jgi:HEAT repeat protein